MFTRHDAHAEPPADSSQKSTSPVFNEIKPVVLKKRIPFINSKTRLTLIVSGVAVLGLMMLVGGLWWNSMSGDTRPAWGGYASNVTMKVYLSKSSVDPDKTEQYSFTQSDPVQIGLYFDGAREQQVTLKIYRGGMGDPVQVADFPLKPESGKDKLTGYRYITFDTYRKGVGEYSVKLLLGGTEYLSTSFGVK